MNKKSLICSNVFCRATVDVDENWEHKECVKCMNTKGLTWTEKKYEGPRNDGQAHPIEYKIQAAVEKKKLW